MMLVTVLPASATTPLRRDAERNRERVLAAAGELFAARGLDVTLDDIARHAGVGVGTVYRRFANKEELIDALFDDKLAEVLAIARVATEHEDPWEGFVTWVAGICELFAKDRGLKSVMLSSVDGQRRADHAREQIMPIVFGLVERAQESGDLRRDIQITDIPVIEFMLGAAAEYSSETSPELWRRYLTIMLDGLRAQRDAPSQLPAPALDVAQLDDVMRCWR
jgi:AcrR family transcriptional regulator